MIPKPAYQFKMVLVGDSAVGKSSILRRFVDDQFTDGLLSTIGVDFKFRRIKIETQEEVKLQIWDTAGQQTFRALVSAYYNSADAIVIVYDITSQQSFEVIILRNILQSLRQYWIKQVEEHNQKDAIVILMGNKSDDKQLRRVQSFSIEGFMETYKIDSHYEVSAKDGSNIQNAFKQISSKLAKNQRNNLGSKTTKPNKLQNTHLNNSVGNNNQQKSKCCLK